MASTATDYLINESEGTPVPLYLFRSDDFATWLKQQEPQLRAWVAAQGFTAEPGSSCVLPGDDGVAMALAARGEPGDPFAYGELPLTLPPLDYLLAGDLNDDAVSSVMLGWAFGAYSFQRYRKEEKKRARLIVPSGGAAEEALQLAQAIYLVRDLINTPAGDLGPEELAEAARSLAEEYGGECRVLTGDELLSEGYPAVHAVGRAASRAPRMIELSWGQEGPLVALVGKGVCFDSGGLDLKPAAGMKLMKKDMGGAAQVLGLAKAVMACGLPLRLSVLVPAVENAVSGDAFRPLDVLETRKGLTVEVGNTDAEGRLILCDALARASELWPDVILDYATLTGAARVALGTELPALFCNNDRLAEQLLAAGMEEHDPLWRMPLHQPYKPHFKSSVADLNNIADHSFGGAIIAALFLEAFVAADRPWAHVDLMAWNTKAGPGRPVGGEAMGMRAAFAYLKRLSGAS